MAGMANLVRAWAEAEAVKSGDVDSGGHTSVVELSCLYQGRTMYSLLLRRTCLIGIWLAASFDDPAAALPTLKKADMMSQ